MRQISEFPRVELGVLPTPLYKLENLSRETGKNIYIKRDDMIGVALGGNKVRKLEFLLADAKEKGVDVVFTAGGAQSNHAMLIPVGGSVPLGSLGYVNCAREIAQQAEQMKVHFDSIVSATGSGGTYAGLTYGAKLYMPSTRSVGIGVCDDPFEEISYDLMCGIQELLESDVPVERKDIHMHFHIGPGCAIPSEEGCAAVRRLARAEGILMDPVYTGKALAGFFQLLEKGYFDQDENILLLHSGGAGALFAVDLLAE